MNPREPHRSVSATRRVLLTLSLSLPIGGRAVLVAGEESIFAAPGFQTTKNDAELVAVDVDADGHLDVVGTRDDPDPTNWAMLFLRGKGDGTFEPPVFVPLSIWPGRVLPADLDGDGCPELVIGHGRDYVTSPAFYVLVAVKWSPAGFTQHPLGMASAGISHLGAGDVDGDGDVDLCYRWFLGGSTRLIFNQGGLTFSAPMIVVGGAQSFCMLNDVDEDGLADMVGLHPQGLRVFRGNGFGNFFNADLVLFSQNTSSAFLADINGDAMVDAVAATHNDVRVRLGQGPLLFGPETVTPTDDVITLVGAADADGDGLVDVLGTSDVVMVERLRNLGGGVLAPNEKSPVGGRLDGFGDFDEDGRADALVSAPVDVGAWDQEQGFIVLAGPGGGFIGISSNDVDPDIPSPSPAEILVGDLNGDGVRDFAEVRADVIYLFQGLGGGSFQPVYGMAQAPHNAPRLLADFNQDGAGDLLLAHHVLLSNSGFYLFPSVAGGFGTGLGGQVGLPGNQYAAGDIDLDGDLDVVATPASGAAFVLGDGTGAFLPTTGIPQASARATGVALHDFDLDGRLDLYLGLPRSQAWQARSRCISAAPARRSVRLRCPRSVPAVRRGSCSATSTGTVAAMSSVIPTRGV